MSATLAVLLKELDPNIKLEIVELQERSHRKLRGTTPVPATRAFAS